MELTMWASALPVPRMCTRTRTRLHPHAHTCGHMLTHMHVLALVCTPVQTPGAPHSRENSLPQRKPHFAVISLSSLRGGSSDTR